MSTSAISTPPVRSSQKRPGDVISQSPTKRTQLTLPQIPPDMEQAPLMGDKAVLLALTRHYNWVIDEVATPLSDQQFADLFDVIMRCEWEIHSDWKPIANNKEERLTMFLRAVRVAGSALKDALDEAWIDGAFVRIRNAAFLRSPLPKDPSLNISDEGGAVIAVRNAWKTTYTSNYHMLLLEVIVDLMSGKQQDPTVPDDYKNTVSIIQSSGAGKSRMVDEAARIVFTFPLNLRPDSDSALLAYPPPDPAVRRYLSAVDTEETVRIRYHAFFMALWQCANAEIKLLLRTPVSQSNDASLWRDHLEEDGIRANFYKAICEQALYASKHGDGISISSMRASSKSELACLQETLKSKVLDLRGVVDILIYFDEAHELTKNRPLTSDTKTLYDVLLSVLNDYKDFPFFVVFLSTNLHIADFAPPRTNTQSSRAARSGALHAPITETPFDCAPNILIEQDTYTREETAQAHFIARFGRPLFWTSLAQIGVTQLSSIEAFFRTVRSKLINFDCSVLAQDCSELGRLAVADVRLCLQYEPSVEGKKSGKTQADMVASHMRIAYSVPIHREHFPSGYSSEPFLAEAAAQQMNYWRGSQPSILLDIISHHMNDGLLDRGERGEVVARMLIIEAYDRAVIEAFPYPIKQLRFSFGCPLIGWINQMFTDTVAKTILDSKPANCGNLKFQEVFKDAWIRFTHYAKAVDDHIFNTHSMFAAFIRGMAFICRNGESFVDILIPVLLHDKKIGSSTMTAIFIQVKRRVGAGHYVIDAEKQFEFFELEPTLTNNDRPYVTLVMDLGVQNPIPGSVKAAAIGVIKKSKTFKTRQRTAAPSKVKAPPTPSKYKVSSTPKHSSRRAKCHHPRYEIYVSGCSNTIYNVIAVDQRQTYRTLLRLNEFLREHSRPKTVAQVMRLKPAFALGPNSYSWVQSNVLNPMNPDDIDDEVEEGVSIGLLSHRDVGEEEEEEEEEEE